MGWPGRAPHYHGPVTWEPDDRSSRRGAAPTLPEPTRVAPTPVAASRPGTRGSVGADPGRRRGKAVPRIQARDLGRRGPITAFTRLARVHALSIAGDALFAIGLAGTVFFSTDPHQAQWKVALYLVLTVAPFAVAAPLIGPALDRKAGGRRWVVFGAAAARALLALLLVRNLDSLWFYPEAFLMLVLSKVHLISKSALVPTTVRTDEELVEANSKLALLGAIAVVAAALPGLVLLKIGPPWVLALASIVFLATALQAFALPDTKVAEKPADAAEKAELRSAGIVLAASAMGLVRGIVGFLTFLLAFDFKNNDRPLWWLGLVASFAQIGYFLGALVAPRLRKRLPEERIIILSLAATVMMGLVSAKVVDTAEVGAVSGVLLGAALLSFGVGLTSSTAKQGFDALVQRDAPDANRGRSFARFETRFQLIWVLGAFLPVVLPIPPVLGMLLIVAVAAFALVSYWVGERQIRAAELGHRPPPDPRGPTAGVVARAASRRRARRLARRAAEASVPEAAAPTGSSPVDPTVATAPGPGLFGQPDVPLPPDLLVPPPSGLFGADAPTAPTPTMPIAADDTVVQAAAPVVPADDTVVQAAAPVVPADDTVVQAAAPVASSGPSITAAGGGGPIPGDDPTLPFEASGPPPTPHQEGRTAVPATSPAPPRPSWASPVAPSAGPPPPKPSWASPATGRAPAAASSPSGPSSDEPSASPTAPRSPRPTVVEPMLPFDEPDDGTAPSRGPRSDWDTAEPHWRDG